MPMPAEKKNWIGAEARDKLDTEMEGLGWVTMQVAADILGISLGTLRQKKHHGSVPPEALFKHERSQGVYVSREWAKAQVALPGA